MTSQNARRPWGASKHLVPIQARVTAEMREAAKVRANELGVSLGRYIEAAIQADLDAHVVKPQELDFIQEKLTDEYAQEKITG